MALIKNIETQFGVNVEYWKVLSIQIVCNTDVHVVIGGYLNQNTRLAGKNPLVVKNLTIPIIQFETLPMFTVIYNELKQQTEFLNALDV